MNTQLIQSIWQMITSLPTEEQDWLKAKFIEKSHHFPAQVLDINSFSGSIQLSQEPLEFQHQIRNEWS